MNVIEHTHTYIYIIPKVALMHAMHLQCYDGLIVIDLFITGE